MTKPILLTLLSPRYEFSYRVHDALLAHPTISSDYEIQIVPYSPGDEEMPDIAHYNPVGIITALNAETEDMEKLVKTGARVVNMSASLYKGTSSLYMCPEYFSKAVMRHARGAGFKTVVYLSTQGIVNSQKVQGAFFEQEAKESGLGYWQESVSERPLGVSADEWAVRHRSVIERLVNAKERTLVYTFHDWRAVTLLQILQGRGVDIPGEVGVLGRGNTLNARVGRPTISSFATPFLTMTQVALELIQGEGNEERRISNGDIITRESTVGIKESNLLTEKLPKMMQQYGGEGISVDELARLAGVSRSTLERSYRMVHGEAPSAALKRMRMQRIEQLLVSTNLTISSISGMVGFASTSAFSSMFSSHHGVSPGKWRNNHVTELSDI